MPVAAILVYSWKVEGQEALGMASLRSAPTSFQFHICMDTLTQLKIQHNGRAYGFFLGI